MKILVADFHQRDIYNRINEELESLPDIDVLVNNVGALMSKRPNYFAKIDPDQLDEYINVNVFSYQKMIQLLLPRMIQKKRGVIINVSSFSGVNPIPFITPYSASKSFSGLKVLEFIQFLLSSSKSIHRLSDPRFST